MTETRLTDCDAAGAHPSHASQSLQAPPSRAPRPVLVAASRLHDDGTSITEADPAPTGVSIYFQPIPYLFRVISTNPRGLFSNNGRRSMSGKKALMANRAMSRRTTRPTSSSSSSDRSPSPPRRKRMRRAAASPARSEGLWRESRGANGQVVLSLESDDDDGTAKDTSSDSDEAEFEIRLPPPRKRSPVIYSVDSDSEDEDDDDVQIVDPLTPNGTRPKPLVEQKELDDATSNGGKETEENEDEEEEDDEDDEEEEEEEEEEWRPEEDTEGNESHESDEPDEDDRNEDRRKVGERDAPLSTMPPVSVESIRFKQEVITQVKAEPSHSPVSKSASAQPVFQKSELKEVTQPVKTIPTSASISTPIRVQIKSELPWEESHGPLISFSQLDHETPPARVRPSNRHPRAARRSVVRRRRLEEEEAGMLLFDGPQYFPPATVVKTLIEFIARSVGPMSGPNRRWVDYVLLAKLNNSISCLSDEWVTRYSDWMRIALGGENDLSIGKRRIQREPLLALPVRYTLRPNQVVMPKPPASSKPKAKTNAVEKQRSADTKWLEKRAAEVQSGDRRIKSETPRRRASSISHNTGPFSPTSSIASTVSSRRTLQVDVSASKTKRQRGVLASPDSNGMYSPSTASTTTSSPWPSAAFLDLANDDNTTGRNRSMPNEWDYEDSRLASSNQLPVSMNPLFTMSLNELKAHINSVRHDGRVRNFEKPLEILQKIMNHPRNRHGTFNTPVDPIALRLPTYNDIVKNPMDLGTIKTRLEEAAYLEQDDFVADVRLVFTNAMAFNPPDHSVHVDASFLLKHFEELLHGDSRDRHLKRRNLQSSDRHACRVCLGNSCVMCDQGCLPFAQPHLQCAGSCGVDIRKGSIYYITRDGTRVWCAKCRMHHVKTASDSTEGGAKYNKSHSEDPNEREKSKKKKPKRVVAPSKGAENGIEVVEIPGDLVKKKAELDVEPWVKCARCLRWLHQICGLYNPVFGAYTAEHEYNCPLCVWKQRSPPPPLTAPTSNGIANLLNEPAELPAQKLMSSCHQIPTCELSLFIEAFMRNGLKELNEHKAAEDLHVRVLSFPHEKVHVSERAVKAFDENALILEQNCPDRRHDQAQQHRIPSDINYTSRGIYLFQRHEGIDVCLFTLFVQEFGDDCVLESNRRSVYVAYLDSIRYLTPPSARTASYHLIMMAYFDYIRRHGFTRVHIWSCPPQKRISYVFWCRPPFQKTPSAEHLRAWYLRLLTKSKEARIVKSWTNMYNEYFAPNLMSTNTVNNHLSSDLNGDSKSTVATRGKASRSIDPNDHAWPVEKLPPLFDGDFLPAELDRILGRLAARDGKHRRWNTTGAAGKSSSVGSTGGKVAVGEFVTRIKEEKPTATPVQAEFKLREIFDRCQNAVQRLKNDLLVVDLEPPTPCLSGTQTSVELPSWWQLVPRMFGSRFMFHQLCASATYQFDSLRRAKHSTTMLLHHFFNERVRQLNVFCNECFLLISHADFWHCRHCERFALCDLCHHRDGHNHAHELVFGGGLPGSSRTGLLELLESSSAGTSQN